MRELVVENILESISVKEKFVMEAPFIEEAARRIIHCFKAGGKILIFGNGGSAADAQHFAAELVGRFEKERRGFPAIALTTDSSNLTAIGNDYGYSKIFERQVEALAKRGDVLVGISTSGNSENVVLAMRLGKEIGTVNIGLTGRDGGKMKELCDVHINCQSSKTARIQECHLLAYHIICKIVEEEIIIEQ